MPVLNEEGHLEAAVKSIFEQKNLENSKVEVVLALGPSTDQTNSVAESLKSQFPVKIVQNPTGKTANGLNLAIAATQADIIVRVDAHSELSPNYTDLARQILNETGAANVGGVMRAVGISPFQQAVAYAYNSRLGLGGGNYHVGGKAGPSDSVYLGVFRRSSLVQLGGFDESLGRLANQFFSTGIWRAWLTKAHLGKANLRYFAPPALVISCLLGLVFWVTGFLGFLGLIPLAGYLTILILAAIFARKLSIGARLSLLLALPAMHFSWGAGFLAGLLSKR
ncbi:MAG: glycosyltransferase [Actinobacteria bacterium]|nr:glycosyltransferase [Actinomycetota bacterium]